VSTQHSSQPINVDRDPVELAEVIEPRGINAPSFYQRNSGSLPRSENPGISSAHRRATLPTPENVESVSLMDAIKSLLGR
jgi:hypothetical protein